MSSNMGGRLGEEEGFRVGEGVGAGEGLKVGLVRVGDSDGCPLGWAEGCLDGVTDG